ncbi:hypothetical protein [Sedimenticola sp.]|uniref:hypothetical protein n=1 Tax=Sedimenticola sp. TaxID=1940285 RepID=UPI003D1355F5
MDSNSDKRPTDSVEKSTFDFAHFIKWIILVFLILLLIAQLSTGEAARLAKGDEPSWLILLLKLLLIAGVIYLMKVQKDLKCQLTDPSGCTQEEPDPVNGILIVRVRGTAAGFGFGSYTLDLRKDGDPPLGVDVSYPGGGGSGSSPVVSGELGQIDTTTLSDGAYEVLLTVYPVGAGAPKTCSIGFNLLKTFVYISRVAEIPALSTTPTLGNANPYDPLAELRLESAPDYPFRSVGGKMSMDGSAYVYECAGRMIEKYEIRYTQVSAPSGEPGQPAPDAPIPPAFTNTVSPLPLEYLGPDYYAPWTRVGPAPTNLINSWKSVTVGTNTYHKLKEGKWNSAAAGSGRFSLLLTVTDTASHLYHDIQHVWIDNHPIKGKIVKFQWKNPKTGKWEDIPKCEDLSMKKHGTIRIIGLAWDPVIDEAWWPATAPNDNFGHYNLAFWKQFGAAQALTGDINSRVPALPAATPVAVPGDADAEVLAEWDLTSLDGGIAPSPYTPPADPLLYQGESCSYTVRLFVTDTTVVNESTTHHIWDYEAVKIVNDL